MPNLHALLAIPLLLSAFTPSGQDSSSRRTAPVEPAAPRVRYQKAIAPFIATSVETYPAAKARYLAGLARKEALYVSVRLAGNEGPSALAVIKVSDIDEKRGLIYGRAVEDFNGRFGLHQRDDVAVRESEVIDWKITHADGTEEGNALGRYIASLGPGANPSDLMVDQRDKDLAAIEKSQTVEKAVSQTLLQFFDDKELKVESVPSTAPATMEWPALGQKYHAFSPGALLTELNARAAAVKATRKVTVEDAPIEGKDVVRVAAYVVVKKGNVMFEVKQFVHFCYGDSKALERVTWGPREGQWIDLDSKAN